MCGSKGDNFWLLYVRSRWHKINLCWGILKNWRVKVKFNIEHNPRREGFVINLVNSFVKFGWNEVNLGTSSGVFNRRPTTGGSCKFDTKSSIGWFTTDTRTSCPVSNIILIRRAPVDNWTHGPAVLKIIPGSLFNINSLFMLETLTCALDNLRILEGRVNTENNGKHRSLLVTNSLIK